MICFVPRCESGSNRSRKRNKLLGIKNTSFFSPPKKDSDLFEKWCRKIPRGDRKLTLKDRVCSIHFREEDIIKFDEMRLFDGSLFRSERLTYKLREGAYPRIFPNCPAYLSDCKKNRKKPKERLPYVKNSSNKVQRKQILANNNSIVVDHIDVDVNIDVDVPSLDQQFCLEESTFNCDYIFLEKKVNEQLPYVKNSSNEVQRHQILAHDDLTFVNIDLDVQSLDQFCLEESPPNCDLVFQELLLEKEWNLPKSWSSTQIQNEAIAFLKWTGSNWEVEKQIVILRDLQFKTFIRSREVKFLEFEKVKDKNTVRDIIISMDDL